MPDDEIIETEVTAQEADVKEDPPEETVKDEDESFGSDTDEAEEELEGLEREEEPEKEEKKPEKPEKEPKSEEEEEEPDEEEEDEDIKRGKELIEAEKKEEEDKKSKEEEDKSERQEVVHPSRQSYSPKAISILKNAVPKNLLPDTVELEDGTQLDFKTVIDNDPEIPVMASAIAYNLIQQMVANGFLATPGDIDSIREDFDGVLFDRTLTNKQYGIPNAQDISKSPEFQEWIDKQSDEIKALKKSSDPYDHIRLYNRFLNHEARNKADEKVKKIDEKRKVKKQKFDSVLKTTGKSKGGRGQSTLSPEELENDGFTSKDDDDDLPG